MITHSNKKNVGVSDHFLSLTVEEMEVMEKKIVPGEAFITGKRAYVFFDGVKIIRMSKNPDCSLEFKCHCFYRTYGGTILGEVLSA